MYNYETEKPKLFTDEGQRKFLTVRDHVKNILEDAGAITMGCAMSAISGDSWEMMMYVDRLVEINEIREINQGQVAGQNRIFVEVN